MTWRYRRIEVEAAWISNDDVKFHLGVALTWMGIAVMLGVFGFAVGVRSKAE